MIRLNKGGFVKVAYFYRNRRYKSYKKKRKNNIQPPRKLQLYCLKHGELIGYSNMYKSPVYEALNLEKNKVELKCFKCLEEKIEPEREANYSKYNEADKQANNKYGKIGRTLLKCSIVCYYLAFGGYLFFIYLWGAIEALVPSGILVILGFIFNKRGNYLHEKYIDYRKELTKDLNYVPDAESIVRDEKYNVSSWRREQERIKKEKMEYTLAEIDKMTGIEFEEFVKILLQKNGYEYPQITKASGDYGVDIIAYKNGKKIGIQCKRYSNKVSVSAIQEVSSAKNYYNLHELCVITNSTFTENAITLARANNVSLIDRIGLYDLIQDAQGVQVEKGSHYQTTLF